MWPPCFFRCLILVMAIYLSLKPDFCFLFLGDLFMALRWTHGEKNNTIPIPMEKRLINRPLTRTFYHGEHPINFYVLFFLSVLLFNSFFFCFFWGEVSHVWHEEPMFNSCNNLIIYWYMYVLLGVIMLMRIEFPTNISREEVMS